jgi:DNA polymerase-1
VTLYNPVKKKEIESPDYDYVTWKALRGDPTDNIKGIPKVGDKTAHKLVSNPELLKEFLSDPVKRDIFDKNVNLIRLVDLSRDMDSMSITESRLDEEGLHSYISELEFSLMLKEKTWNKYIDTFKEVGCRT